MKARNHGKELPECERVIKGTPNNSTAYYNQGMVLFGGRRYEEAAKSFKKAISLNRSCGEAYYYMGVALRVMGRYEEAIEAFNKAIRINPDSPIMYDQRSATLIDISESSPPEQARSYLEQALHDAVKAFQLSHGQTGCYSMTRAIEHRKKPRRITKNHASEEDK